MQQTDEQRLITRILNGHTEDYSYFMERYGENVFRLVAKLVTTQEDAEELVQDAFVRAYNHLSDFTGEASFSTWIYRIAYNLTVSWLRKQKMKYLRELSSFIMPVPSCHQMNRRSSISSTTRTYRCTILPTS